MNMFLDIETLPAADELMDKVRFLYERKIERWLKKRELDGENGNDDANNGNNFDKYYKNTSFDGSFGRILCIAYAFDNDPVEVVCNPDDEKKTLQDFWELARNTRLFIGHNVMDFDLRFIYQRSIINRVTPSRNLNFARYRSEPIFDTMKEWGKWGTSGNIGLEHLAIALGIPTPKDGVDGSQVFDFYQAGRIKEICDYCKRDVETTRTIYKRMAFKS